IPALLVVAVRGRLREPETWQSAKRAASASQRELGSVRDLLGDRRWRSRTIVGVALALAGIIGVWGIAFWAPELIRGVLRDQPPARQDEVASLATALQDVGAFFGIMAFTWLTVYLGRRKAFLVSLLFALGVVLLVFGTMRTESQIWWMIPLLGFATLTVFGGYAIYFPELFPTRLRSTGTGFCYSTARYLAAFGPFTLGGLGLVYADLGAAPSDSLRYAAMTVASAYLIGMVALIWAPETQNQPLPE